VIGSGRDPIAAPAHGRASAERIGAAHHVEIPGAVHGVTIQCAERIYALLREHLTRLEEQYAGLTSAF
jgi:pimeloyl-ACP methyl ester carboxylesterase